MNSFFLVEAEEVMYSFSKSMAVSDEETEVEDNGNSALSYLYAKVIVILKNVHYY